MSKCASCHGADGNSTVPQYPKLAGQDEAYLYGQLQDFKKGIRRSDVMSAIVAGLPDADLAATASFYAQQTIRPDPVEDKTLASAGERIFLTGDEPEMPPCATCHGSRAQQGQQPTRGMMGGGMMGMMHGGMTAAAVPTVGGQHAAYLLDQLNRFADGTRQGTAMNRIAAALTGKERKAVVEYLSGLR